MSEDALRTIAWMEHDVVIARSLVARFAFVVLGLVFLGVGILGYVVPGLPGTLFLLIAAWFFSMSHPRLYHWMMTNRWFGKTLRDYRAGLGIPAAHKGDRGDSAIVDQCRGRASRSPSPTAWVSVSASSHSGPTAFGSFSVVRPASG